ncbi:hypothetical protein C1H76_5783 [Elsinoe australis]|uniref:Uncharacterized protein n=1 Tax=Elsinoe australis TaxID=40998 RepID=A0A4U7AYB6_9PEZI|nr:hypothetical protein C1H76_5783 [Elsinoe australis]
MYQDPAIPSLLRLTCCAILGQGDGEYLAFAKEGVEIAEQNLALDLDKKTFPLWSSHFRLGDFSSRRGQSVIQQNVAPCIQSELDGKREYTEGNQEAK